MQVTLKISGMHCADCAVTVQKALAATPGTKDAKVSYLKKQAVVEAADGTPVEELVSAVARSGYGADPVASGR